MNAHNKMLWEQIAAIESADKMIDIVKSVQMKVIADPHNFPEIVDHDAYVCIIKF